MDADPGFLSSILASNLVQWAHLGQTPVARHSSWPQAAPGSPGHEAAAMQ